MVEPVGLRMNDTPSKERWICPVHGDIGGTGFGKDAAQVLHVSLFGDIVETTDYCLRCLRDQLDKNIPRLALIEGEK